MYRKSDLLLFVTRQIIPSSSGLLRLGKRLSWPVVAGDPCGEAIERGAGEIQDQRDGVDRQRQGVAEPVGSRCRLRIIGHRFGHGITRRQENAPHLPSQHLDSALVK